MQCDFSFASQRLNTKGLFVFMEVDLPSRHIDHVMPHIFDVLLAGM